MPAVDKLTAAEAASYFAMQCNSQPALSSQSVSQPDTHTQWVLIAVEDNKNLTPSPLDCLLILSAVAPNFQLRLNQ